MGDAKSPLLGKNSKQYAEILKWMSLANLELIPNLAGVFQPLTGAIPYNKKSLDEHQAKLNAVVSIFESRLAEYTYLVGERLSLADVFAASAFVRGFEHLFGVEWRKSHPNVARWYLTVTSQKILKDVLPEAPFTDKPVEYTPPKKEKKKQEPAAPKAAAPKAAAPAEDAPAPQAPKPKHPLEALGKPKAPLDEWKRIYSNKETREEAIPWFWENQYNPEEWSLWKVDYKYNDELTLTFMSNNLVGGFFNRLSASSKYIFGCMVVYGENNDNGITGFFLVRGQEHEPAFDVAPDWESYSFSKLEPTEENKKFINNMLAWDEPVIVDGKERVIADGKVCK